MHQKQFGVVAVSLAAGVGESTLRSWFDRGLIPILNSDRAATGRGIPREIDLHTALQVGVAAELVRLGLSARRSCQVALSFSDTGNSLRDPGELFSNEKTMLVVLPKIDAGQVVAASQLPSLIDRVAASSIAIVDVNEVYRNMLTGLSVALPASARN